MTVLFRKVYALLPLLTKFVHDVLESVVTMSRGLHKVVPGLPKKCGRSGHRHDSNGPTYTTSVGLAKICLTFEWPTQMKIPRTAQKCRLLFWKNVHLQIIAS